MVSLKMFVQQELYVEWLWAKMAVELLSVHCKMKLHLQVWRETETTEKTSKQLRLKHQTLLVTIYKERIIELYNQHMLQTTIIQLF